MPKASKATIDVQGTAVTVLSQSSDDFISLTDIAKHKEPDRSDQVIQNWMRNRNTIEFLGVWERLNNVSFKPLEFEGFRTRAGLNSFVLTPRQWIDATHASGLVSKSGRYGGTYVHRDIAFEFASWISCHVLESARAAAKRFHQNFAPGQTVVPHRFWPRFLPEAVTLMPFPFSTFPM